MYIKDNMTGTVRMYGTNHHDALLMSEDDKLKKGDFIKCRDKEDAGNIADALVNSGIDWDFCYEKNGEKGIWIEIKEDE